MDIKIEKRPFQKMNLIFNNPKQTGVNQLAEIWL